MTVWNVAFSLMENGTPKAVPLAKPAVPRLRYKYSVLKDSQGLKAYSSPPPTVQPFCSAPSEVAALPTPVRAGGG